MYEGSYEKEKAMKQLLNWGDNTGVCHQPWQQRAQCLGVCGVCWRGQVFQQIPGDQMLEMGALALGQQQPVWCV